MIPPAETRSAPPAILVEGLTKRYRDRRGDVVAVDDVSFRVEPNEVVGLLGPNGAGKTTIIKCLCTLVLPTAGRIEVHGVDVRRHPRAALHGIAALLEGNRNVYWRLTPAENLRFFAELHGIPRRHVRDRVDELLERFGLAERVDTPAMKLSRGNQQKLALACALVHGAELLVLDEPTLGLDVRASTELRRFLRDLADREGRTILLSSHDMNVVRDVCDRAIIVNHGRIVVDDRIDNLLELFRARTYRFHLEGELRPERARLLRERFDRLRIDAGPVETVVEVDLLDHEGLYEVIDVLREDDRVIESIDRVSPDLEEIFLDIVEGRRAVT